MRRIYISMLLLGAMTAPAAADTATFSYSDLSEEYAMYGTSAKETYDVAVRLARPELVGMKVAGFSVPMYHTDSICGIRVWMSTELGLTADKQPVTDIVCVPAEIDGDFVRVSFPDPYTITEQGVYVGYSFEVTATETGKQATNKPVALTYGTDPDGFYFHTKRTQQKWTDKSSAIGGLSMIAVELEGNLTPVGCRISFPTELDIDAMTESYEIPVTLVNSGTEPVSRLTFSYGTEGNVREYEYEYPSPALLQFAREYTIGINVGNYLANGMNFPTLRLTSVNGKPNPLAESGESGMSVFQYTDAPVRIPLVEEYTGLWCGWCPRGYVALENMGEKYPDRFIGVAIHSGDDMAVIPSAHYPNEAPGLPLAWVDRSERIDPMESIVTEKWRGHSDEYSWVDMSIEADEIELSPTAKGVRVDTRVKFERPVNREHRIFYYLLAEGLTHESWYQNNYFSGRNPEDYPGMEEFISYPEKVSGLVFNDVLVQSSSTFGIENSLPAASDIVPGEWIDHSYTFDLTESVNLDGTLNFSDMAKGYSVVAGVVDFGTGRVVNARKLHVGDSAVNNFAESTRAVSSREYYDLNGMRTETPDRGLFIEKTVKADGATEFRKIYIAK